VTGAAFERSDGPVVVSPRDEQRQITTVDDWLEWAGPLRGEKQWADRRSAKEVAKAWCRPDGTIAVPSNLQSLLDSNPTLGTFRAATAIPELPTPLGDVPRGARRHDLVILGLDAAGRPTLVGVEAKADEPFDAPVSERLAAALAVTAAAEAEKRDDRSAQIPRIERFGRALFGRAVLGGDSMADPKIGALPYQLLAGLAGILIETDARGAEQAAFVVHAFHSDALDPEKLATNDAAYARFVAALPGGAALEPEYGRLHGPLRVPGGEGIPSFPLYVGITATQLGG
jgi:hypothetical protein